MVRSVVGRVSAQRVTRHTGGDSSTDLRRYHRVSDNKAAPLIRPTEKRSDPWSRHIYLVGLILCRWFACSTRLPRGGVDVAGNCSTGDLDLDGDLESGPRVECFFFLRFLLVTFALLTGAFSSEVRGLFSGVVFLLDNILSSELFCISIAVCGNLFNALTVLSNTFL